MGRRFLWRVGGAFVLIWLFAFAFFGFVGWYTGARFGGGPPHGAPLRSFGLLAGLVLLLGLTTAARALRRATVPLGGVVEATGRLAEGQYDVRVREWGPPEARALARAFNQMAARLQAHEQQRRDLLADVAHELRTPLAVVQGNLEGLLDGVYPRDDAHLVPVLEEARVLSTLIEDLRTLALAETGTLALHREPTDLGELIDDTVAAFQPQAASAGVTLAAEYGPDLPVVTVDPVRLRQVLTNLLTNALQHSASGGAIRVTAAPADTAPAQVTITVADTGTGIGPDDLPHIFDRFYKAQGSRGTGLGLAIARNLVVLHGGRITAESTLDAGTTVRVMLPLAPHTP